jgi:hypothetical protein
MTQENTNLVLISGKSATGKSFSMKSLKDPKGVVYLNCENNKRLPFKSQFKEFNITHPGQVYEGFAWAETQGNIHTIVVDSLTYLMDLYEIAIVDKAANTQKAWGTYRAFFKELMAKYVAMSTKSCIFLAHTADVYNEQEMAVESFVKVKGSIMNTGVESYFSTVISTKKMSIQKLENYSSPLLNITEEEKELGFKYVFQTRITKDSIHERIRSSDMWKKEETFIDNNAQYVIERLHQYYK